MNRTWITAAATAAAMAISASASAQDSQPTTAELRTQIEQLQKQVSQLEARQSDQQQKFDRRDVDAAVDAVKHDADRRSELMQVTGFTAGYDKNRFKIQSADGSFLIQPILYAQFRNNTNFRQDTTGPNDDEVQNGFELRRARFGFDGNAFSKDLSYYFLWDANRNGGAVTLWQAWVKYQINDGWGVRLGQFVNPIIHEQTTSATKQLAVERSLADALVFGVDEAKTQAVSFTYDNGPISVETGFEDGFNSFNTDFRDFTTAGTPPVTTGDGFGAFTRLNFFVFGDRSSYGDFTTLGNKKDLLVFGGGLDFTQDGDLNLWRHTVDAQWKVGKLGLYAAYYGNYIQAPDDDTYNWGALAQAGYALDEHWEPFARYDISSFDDEVPVVGGTEDTFNEITGGVNYYFHGHNAKITVDLSLLPNGSPSDQTSQGILASGDNEWLLRAQFQLML